MLTPLILHQRRAVDASSQSLTGPAVFPQNMPPTWDTSGGAALRKSTCIHMRLWQRIHWKSSVLAFSKVISDGQIEGNGEHKSTFVDERWINNKSYRSISITALHVSLTTSRLRNSIRSYVDMGSPGNVNWEQVLIVNPLVRRSNSACIPLRLTSHSLSFPTISQALRPERLLKARHVEFSTRRRVRSAAKETRPSVISAQRTATWFP
jgi:hypothetical protein